MAEVLVAAAVRALEARSRPSATVPRPVPLARSASPGAAVKTPSSVDRWLRDYLRQLDRKIRRERFERELSDYKAKMAEHRRWKEQHRIDLVRLQAQSPIATTADREALFRVVAWDLVRPGTEGFVRMWRAHVDELARTYRIQVDYVEAIRGVNAYAWYKAPRIEISPIHNAEAYATALHEVGHCVAPHEDRVRSEILAWQWAIEHARPHWTREMHAELASALPTYAKHATPAEQGEITALASSMTYYDARLRRARSTAPCLTVTH